MSDQTLSDYACAPAPYLAVTERISSDGDGTPQTISTQNAVLASLDKLWDIGHNNDKLQALGREISAGTDIGTVVLFYEFLDTPGVATNLIPNMQGAVAATIKTWQAYANVRFVDVSIAKAKNITGVLADIRIKFMPSAGSWSVVGKTTYPYQINSDQPTLNLGWLSGNAAPSDNDKGTILHEFGHALGMMHEHQSPARGEKITLKTDEVYKFYLPLLRYDRNLVRSQVIDVYDSDKSNFSHFDQTSIMMYFMPAYLNYENIGVKVNVQLSELDKAYVALAYPYNSRMKLLHALGTVGVPDDDAGKILEPLDEEATQDTLPDILTEVRQNFFAYNKANIEAAALLNAKNRLGGGKQNSVWTQSAAPYYQRDKK